ncbi:hypothetical protein GPALN_005218 [Globodera pallida]|nr:hypothetical protein GPALN_005218 [Globodera pallida]
MKLDKLLEQMMVMQQQHQQSVHQQQQQQMDNEGAEFQQNAQQTEHDEGRQFHQQCADNAQNSSGTTNGTNACFQSSNNGQSFGEMLASTNSAKYKKSDEFLHPLHGAIGQTSPQSQHSPQQQSLAPAVGMPETQHLAFLSAFLRANLPMSPLSAFSTSSLQPQQILAVPNIPSPAPQQIVPLSKEVASQGLFAVGGCRPCQKTFTTRLELIHHCVDHFPATFYSFEERSAPNGEHSPPQTTKNGNKNSAPNGSGLHQLDDTFVEASQKMDILGQLAGLLALNENGSPSPGSSAADLPFHGIPNSLFTNFFKSFVPMPLQQLTTAENANNLEANGSAEDVREQQRGKSASSAPNSNHPSSRPSSSSNSSKANSAVRKRQIHQEKAANSSSSSRESAGKGRTGDGPSTSSVGSNKNQRKNNGGERSRNGGSGRTAPTKTASSTASSLPGLSELPYHMCPHCCLTFAETSAFRAHLSVHESEVTAHAIPTTIAPFMAPTALTSVANLVVTTSGGAETVANSQQQQTTLKCMLCEMKFVSAFRLSEHMRLHSAHMCSQCQKTFMTAFDLNLHMGTHTGFTYDCKDCGKCFPCRKTLAEHNRSHRMILSGGGGSASPEPPKKAKTSGGLLTISQDRENSPDFGGPNGDSGNEKRRLRVAKRGEKSRRNATLVAVESTAASPPIALPPVSSASSSWPSSPTNALLLSSLTAAMCGGDGWTPGIANAAQEHPNASASTDKPGGNDDVLEGEEEKNGAENETNAINGERRD